jgi:tol-pal system protein YbgF
MQKSPYRLALGCASVGISLVIGCARQVPPDRTVEKLRADLAKMEADRDRLEQRVGALEALELRRREAQEVATPPTSARESARPLPVVRVSEEEGRPRPNPTHGETPDVDSGSVDHRPMVHANGSRGGTERRGAKDDGDAAVAFSADAKRDYDAALGHARAKRHDQALQAFTAFLVRYPDHPYVENAMYWRGECFFATGAFSRAVEQFEGVIARFPYGNKAADAWLKLGLSRDKAGAKDQAEKAFAELQARYPKSDAARQIPHL